MAAPALREILVCPRCYAPLELPEPPTAPTCACGARYAWDDGAPDLTPLSPPPEGTVATRWALWEQLQQNGAAAYEAEPASSLSVGDRVDARLFGAFADLRGRVLDVGCGPQSHPSYVPDVPGVELFGIDPLRGVAARDFIFVRGLAEYLPFAARKLRPGALRDLDRPFPRPRARAARGTARGRAGWTGGRLVRTPAPAAHTPPARGGRQGYARRRAPRAPSWSRCGAGEARRRRRCVPLRAPRSRPDRGLARYGRSAHRRACTALGADPERIPGRRTQVTAGAARASLRR